MAHTLLLLALGLLCTPGGTIQILANHVTTTTGQVMGSVETYLGTHEGGDYLRFHGIPYAEPPVGRRRFQDPEPVAAWRGVKDCSGGPPAICPQFDFFAPPKDPGSPIAISGSEDCLFLNIYTQSLPSQDMQADTPLRPVLFYIHGGGFVLGSGAGQFGMNSSGEDYMMEAGIVLVTFNYRLGPLGFMAIPDTNIQGNMGMKDQLLAMRWVKQNIARFGGDPGRITISGLSAGGVSVHGHVLSPLGSGEGLFHRAISHSGTMLMPVDSEGVFQDSRLFLEKMCNVNTTVEGIPKNLTASCLFSLPAEELIAECVKSMALWSQPMARKIELEKADPTYLGYRLWVVVDDYADTPFMPSHPVTVLHNQQQKMVPFMSGVAKDEGAMMAPMLWKDMNGTDNIVKDNWGHIGAKNLFPAFREYTFEDQLKAKMIAHFYVGEGGLVRANKQGLSDMFTDAYFAAPNTETIRLHAKAPAPVYNYMFSYKGSFSFVTFYAGGNQEILKEDWGVAHGDDALYLGKFSIKGQALAQTETDKQMVDIYMKLITNFIRYGDPTPVAYSTIPQWPPAQASRSACVYMDISLEPRVRHRMFSDRMTFWHMVTYRDMLEQYAVDKKEARMLVEIESAIDGDEDDDDSSEEDSSEEDTDANAEGLDQARRLRKRLHRLRKQTGRRGGWRKVSRRERSAAKLEARRRRRLAKKLRNLME